MVQGVVAEPSVEEAVPVVALEQVEEAVELPVGVVEVEAVVLRSFQEDQPSAEVEDVLEVPEGVAEVVSVLEDAMVP